MYTLHAACPRETAYIRHIAQRTNAQPHCVFGVLPPLYFPSAHGKQTPTPYGPLVCPACAVLWRQQRAGRGSAGKGGQMHHAMRRGHHNYMRW